MNEETRGIIDQHKTEMFCKDHKKKIKPEDFMKCFEAGHIIDVIQE